MNRTDNADVDTGSVPGVAVPNRRHGTRPTRASRARNPSSSASSSQGAISRAREFESSLGGSSISRPSGATPDPTTLCHQPGTPSSHVASSRPISNRSCGRSAARS